MTKIVHASIPADNPRQVATVLAELLGGEAMPFPPGGPAAWIAWASDGLTEIEVVRRGDRLVRGPDEAEWRPDPALSRGSEVHLALTVDLPAEKIVALARKAGWPLRTCIRGGLFALIELWVEDAFLIELFDPAQARHFAQAISSEKWRAMLAGPPSRPASAPVPA